MIIFLVRKSINWIQDNIFINNTISWRVLVKKILMLEVIQLMKMRFKKILIGRG